MSDADIPLQNLSPASSPTGVFLTLHLPWPFLTQAGCFKLVPHWCLLSHTSIHNELYLESHLPSVSF